jgi:hypothetical protein
VSVGLGVALAGTEVAVGGLLVVVGMIKLAEVGAAVDVLV